MEIDNGENMLKEIRKDAFIRGPYRYYLYRTWNDLKDFILWIMLNPSVADSEKDDPTIRRIMDYTYRWGFGGFWVCNMYAYIETDSKKLLTNKSIDYGGPMNINWIESIDNLCAMTILACGSKVSRNRFIKVYDILKKPVYTLKVNKDGFPAHPLYLRKDLEPVKYEFKP